MALGGFKDWYYYSDCSSDSSSEERYINEWENKVNLDGGLFYVKHHLRKDDANEESRNSMINDNINVKSSSGFLGRFMRRRNSRRSFRRSDTNVLSKKEAISCQENTVADNNKEKGGENDQVFVRINVDSPSTNQISMESLLGLKTAYNNSHIVVTGFTSSRSSLFESRVCLGDRLYSVNGLIVTKSNIDEILHGMVTAKEVTLGFQKVKKEIIESDTLAVNSKWSNDKDYCTINGCIVYAKYEGLSENGPADQGIIYNFPKKGNFLAQIRGAFFTLFHLLSSVSSSPPVSTSIKLNGKIINIIYSNEMNELLLIAFPNSKYFLEESIRIVNSITRCLEFMFQSLTKCFSNKHNVDFLDSFFHKILTKTKRDEDNPGWEFENLLPTPCSFCFPKEIYMQVDDALNELESNCIPSQEGQRLFSVIGSCYFYKGYMICNHLSNKDLLDVTALMKENDILKLTNESVKDLVYWREVYPLSCQRGVTIPSTVPYSVPAGRWFLLIVAMDYSLLVTLFEAGRYTLRGSMIKEPNAAYVEEAQATLRHIKKIAFPDTINKQLNVNAKIPEVFNNDQTKAASTDSSSSLSSYADLQNQNKHYFASDICRTHQSLSNFKGRQSNECIRALGTYLDVDYMAEEEFVPVLGRRAERELALETNSQSRISVSDSISDDSDWLKDNKSTRSFADDTNEFTKSNTPEGYIASPRILSNEENVLIHFVNFELSEGILISSIENINNKSDKYSKILQTFRQHAYKIQKIFRNTILFKKMKPQDKPEILNKSLVAVNEYGSLFSFMDDVKNETVTFWVVGKLFFMPHPREVYVCYFDTCPQSMIEIAFQIALYSSR
ncbi:hypothetical protein O3M35_011855 [Rhynocoris fuscipes]|uniref:Protein inturned n=1 Tax=Rhynocoris fuscipes TaxID=488301 RepID=A0AAW1CXR4_9HEMI